MTSPLWQPSAERIERANLTAFMARVGADYGVEVADYKALHRWSLAAPADFWSAVWDDSGVIAECRGEPALESPERMPGATWFPEARLNFAENFLDGLFQFTEVGGLHHIGVGSPDAKILFVTSIG